MFRRSIEVGNVVVAELAAREMGVVSLDEALELVILTAQKNPDRHSRYATRWLRRWLEETPYAGLDAAALVVGALAALGGTHHQAAATALRTMLE
jgi:hypothetical protein